MKQIYRNLFISLVMLTVSLGAMAAYRVHSVTGTVTVKSAGKPAVTATVGMAVSPADELNIAGGAVIEIINDINKTIYTSTTDGKMTVSRMMLAAKSASEDNTGAVHSQMRFGNSGRDRNSRVYVQTGMVKRSLAEYDPEASGIEIDAATLSDCLYRRLTDAAAADSTMAITMSSDDNGMSFTIDNTLSFPLYFNVIKITETDGMSKAEISALGQPSGCYVLLPRQTITRGTHDVTPQGERHIVVATHCHYNVDEVLAKLNTLFTEGAKPAPELDFDLYTNVISN